MSLICVILIRFISAFNIIHGLGNRNHMTDWQGHLERKQRQIGDRLPALFRFETWPLAIQKRFGGKEEIMSELRSSWEVRANRGYRFYFRERSPTMEQAELYNSIYSKYPGGAHDAESDALAQLQILMAYGPEFVRQMDEEAKLWSR